MAQPYSKEDAHVGLSSQSIENKRWGHLGALNRNHCKASFERLVDCILNMTQVPKFAQTMTHA